MKKYNQQNKWTLLGYESAEEWYFAEWCRECGIDAEYQPESFLLSDSVKIPIRKPRTIGSVHLLHSHTYTPDFCLVQYPAVIATIDTCVDIMLHPIQKGLKSALFISKGGSCLIDVKGENHMSSARASDHNFPINQKWMYERYKQYVNSVIPSKLFERTFYPEVYFWSPTGKERTKKINGEFVGFSKLYKRIGDI
ncbi:MAG: hypothetical protein ACYC5G_04040 [Candidatus Doudnabacteria bacterium]